MASCPTLCHVCARARPLHPCPDRAEECFLVYQFCTVCLDEFILLFPITVKKLQRRELGDRRWYAR